MAWEGGGDPHRLEYMGVDRFTIGWADFTFIRSDAGVATVRWRTEVSSVLYARETSAR